jgi:tetratricopeptide (TPR) repeat protein
MRTFDQVISIVLVTVVTAASLAQQPTAWLANGTKLLQAGKISEAREVFEAELRIDAGNLQAQEGEVAASERLALEAHGAGRMDDALSILLKCKQFAPENPRLLYDLGVLEDEMQLYRDADETLAHLERVSPGTPGVLYAVARIKLDLGQLAPAEEKMQQYLKIKPEDASAHFGLGRVYRQGLQFDKARTEFERSIQLQPQQSEGYYQLGDTELQLGKFPEALANFTKTLERNPTHGGALTGIGIVFYKQKEYDKALDALQKAIAAAPEYQPGHYYLGLALARSGRKEESDHELAIATRLAEHDSQKASSRLRLGEQVPPTKNEK